MAVIAALKQYAEDRNMVFLCSALNDVLDTNSQRNVLTHIRLFYYRYYSRHLNQAKCSLKMTVVYGLSGVAREFSTRCGH